MLVPEAQQIRLGNELHIARALSWVENRHPESEILLKQLQGESKVIGITGPPGAGKSTLVNALVSELNELNHRVAILAVDPSSAFNFGSLLGDRLRMQNLFMEEHVFIRSVSSRGSLGGLSGGCGSRAAMSSSGPRSPPMATAEPWCGSSRTPRPTPSWSPSSVSRRVASTPNCHPPNSMG